MYAKDLVDYLNRIVAKNNVDHVVVCAEKQMLGFLRPELEGGLAGEVKLDVATKDLTNLTPHELHEKLADDGLLPREQRPSVPRQH